MPDESAPETKSVTFRVHMTRSPRFSITYKDKHDLFEAIKKKMAELGVPLDKVLSTDADSEPSLMNNADNVLEAAENYVGYKLYVIDDADEEESPSPCYDDLAVHQRGCCSTDHNCKRRRRSSERHRGHRRFDGRPQLCGRSCFDGSSDDH
ncbi:unnamed protein product [Heligmosomoides polygyrus]|uniref:Ubiquitin-like domain-containing protein n=1 Tax=Heligmosomoides polygyrus TaxID=6339 RepID=A0A183FXB1_HELPZ|nr:unnamed protein product [Heligmosomoides polygyrus]